MSDLYSNPIAAPVAQIFNPRAGRNWFAFVSLWSKDGHKWVLQYRHSECWDLMMMTFRALENLRERRTEEGRTILDEIQAGLANLSTPSPSLRHVVERYYYPALAYSYYCLDQLEEAEEY